MRQVGWFQRRPRFLLFAAIVSVVSIPAVAWADGGIDIASAPELPLGTKVTGAVARLDYWKIAVKSGDTLVMNYEPVGMNGRRMEFCFLTPDVTDFTVRDIGCMEVFPTDYSERKRQTKREFLLPGRYTMIIGEDACLEGGTRIDLACKRPLSYELTALVIRRTSISISPVPKLVKRGQSVTIAGRIEEVETGQVALQKRDGKRWRNVALAGVRSSGRFAFKVKADVAGVARYRVMFPGDSTHRPVRAAVTFTVV